MANKPQRDAVLVYLAAFVRALVVGTTGVLLGIYVAELGHGAQTTGLLIGVGLTGTTLMTAATARFADAIGRRRTLIFVTLLSTIGYAGLALAPSIAWLFITALVGMLNGMGRDRGPAGVVEQALLPSTTDDVGRTWVLARYNIALDAGHALGALAAALPALAASVWHTSPHAGHRAAFVVCGVAIAVTASLYTTISAGVEVPRERSHTAVTVDAETRTRITKLSALFGLDSLGGGFLSSALIAYWFFQRYAMSEASIAALFFAARVLNAMSHAGAAWLARRIGLVNTMVFTHLPSSVFLMLAPFAASPALASALFLAREGLVEMDVPTRQSYVLAIVPPSRRTLASGATNVARTAGWAIGAAAAGTIMQAAMSGPLWIGGAIKIAYDVVLYRSFKNISAPEEHS
jgi:MFS family permease